MKIGFDAKRVFHNASGLGNYGRDVIRIISHYRPLDHLYLYNPKKAKINRLELKSNIHIKLPNGLWKYFSSLWRQIGITRQIHCDQIDLFHGLSGELPQNLKVPSVVTVHDLIFIRHPELYTPIDVKIHLQKVKHACKVAHKIIAISEQTKKDVIDFLNINSEKIDVIYQGCHAQFRKKCSSVELDKIHAKYQLPRRYLLSVGTLEKRKNVNLILEAVANTDHHVVLVGRKTPYVNQLLEYIKNHKMENRVHLLHNVSFEDLPAIYQQAHLFCYPSIFEGFGIPILEALCSGIPVISSKGGCFSEAGGPSSFYVDPKNSTDLKKVILELSSNKSLYQKTIQDGLEHAKQFEDHPIAHNLYKVYQTIKK